MEILERPGWVRSALSLGTLFGWIMLLFEGCRPLPRMSMFVNVVTAVMLTDVMHFLVAFMVLLFGFTTGMSAVAHNLPLWASRWGSWWFACENLMLLSFIQEPPSFHDPTQDDAPYPSAIATVLHNPSADYQSGTWDETMPYALFYILFVLYMIVSAVLLINLLIAMMSARYDACKKNAQIDTRVAFGRLVLRLESLLEFIVKAPGRTITELGDTEHEELSISSRARSGHQEERSSSSRGIQKLSDTRKYKSFRESGKGIKSLQQASGTNVFDDDQTDAPKDEVLTKTAFDEMARNLLQQVDARLERLGNPMQQQQPQQQFEQAAESAHIALESAREELQTVMSVARSGMEERGVQSAQGGDLTGQQVEVVAAATARANEATAKASRLLAKAAHTAAKSLPLRSGTTNEKMSVTNKGYRTFELLRRLTGLLPQEGGLEAAMKDKISAALVSLSKVPREHFQFVTHEHWPHSYPLFSSYETGGDYEDLTKIECEHLTKKSLKIENMRPFLQELFLSREVDGISTQAIQTLAEALDTRGSGLVDEARLYQSWLSWFGAQRPRHALVVVGMQNDLISGSLALRSCDAGEDGASVVPTINHLRQYSTFEEVVLALESHPAQHCSFHRVVTSGKSLVRQHDDQVEDELRYAQLYQRVVLKAPDGNRMPQMLWPQHCVTDSEGAAIPHDLHTEPTDIKVFMGTNARVDSLSAFYDFGKYETPKTQSGTTLISELQRRRVTHVYVCGLALDLAVTCTALHAMEHGLVTHVIKDACCSASKAKADNWVHEMGRVGVRVMNSEDVPSYIRVTSDLDDAIYAARNASRSEVLKAVIKAASLPAHGSRIWSAQEETLQSEICEPSASRTRSMPNSIRKMRSRSETRRFSEEPGTSQHGDRNGRIVSDVV